MELSAVEIALLALGLILSSVASGVFLRHKLPEKHLSGNSKDVIKLATALVATMAALVTALLFASTRASYPKRPTARSASSPPMSSSSTVS